jgi:5-enolpyruvylshikimate-3-phosphate synthase
MALAAAALVSSDGADIEGAEAVSVSYPEFWEHLSRATA